MSKVKGLNAIYQWVIRTIMKDQTGVMQTLPNKDLIDLNVQVTAQRLMQEGVDPTVLKNANQVENAINMIENKAKTKSGITQTKTAEVFDLEGKKIDPKKGIMGGKQIDDNLPPPGSRGGKDDIAAPIQSEDELLEKLNRENKEATRNLQIKLSKDKGYQKFKGETEEEIRKRFGLDDPEDMAQGGRAGFKIGSIDKARRAFLKTAASIGGGIAALKTGLLNIGKDAAPMVEAAKETVTKAPDYFFDLVAKIKLLGEPRRTPSYRERVNEYQYTGKDGNEYLLTEELDTGDIMIQKDKIGGRSFEEGSYDVIEDRTEMVFRKGQADETTKGKPADEYEEYKVEFDQDGTAADATDIDELSKKEIIKEATGDAPPIKKAAGGIARMLGE